MTGMGRVECSIEGETRAWVEIRAVNHKYLDISIRSPHLLLRYEPEIRSLIKSKIARGSVQIFLGWDSDPNPSSLRLNYELCRSYQRLGEELRRNFGIEGKPDLNTLIQLPGVVVWDRSDKEILQVWRAMRKMAVEALDELVWMRTREGRFLAREMERSARRIIKALEAIERRTPAGYRRRRKQIVDLLRESSTVDPKQLWGLADSQLARFDIHEECTRLRSHCRFLLRTLKLRRPVGRRLDFIAQEMLREVNTISAKALDEFIAQQVVRIKEEVEYLREQAQNVE